MFICNHCPYVKHVQEQLVAFAREYMPRGIGVVAINSNDVLAYPDDAPEMMKYEALRLGDPFPYLFDETQDVARAYQAAGTPDFFCFDKDLRCVYRGQLDDSRPGNAVCLSLEQIYERHWTRCLWERQQPCLRLQNIKN